MGATTAATKEGAATKTPYTVGSAEWAAALFGLLPKVAATPNNIANIQRIITVESAGNQAGYLRDNNPLNLNTYSTPHSSLPGGTIVHEFGIYVQTFPTVLAGLQATANQFNQDPALVKALQNNAPPAMFGGALSTSAWKSASYANATKFPTITPFTGSAVTTSLGGTPSGGITSVGDPSNVVGNVGTIASTTASSVPGISDVYDLVKDLTNPAKLKNVGIFVLGLALIGVGLVLTFAKEGEQALSAAAIVGA